VSDHGDSGGRPAVAVLGVGIMGSAMARNLLKAGLPTTVWDRSATATTPLSARLGRERPDVLFVDAPVSGSKGPAESGKLLVLASGPAAAQSLLRPVLRYSAGPRCGWAKPARAAS
jgi:3-hydroxyisobutyrate dehydrogenase